MAIFQRIPVVVEGNLDDIYWENVDAVTEYDGPFREEYATIEVHKTWADEIGRVILIADNGTFIGPFTSDTFDILEDIYSEMTLTNALVDFELATCTLPCCNGEDLN